MKLNCINWFQDLPTPAHSCHTSSNFTTDSKLITLGRVHLEISSGLGWQVVTILTGLSWWHKASRPSLGTSLISSICLKVILSKAGLGQSTVGPSTTLYYVNTGNNTCTVVYRTQLHWEKRYRDGWSQKTHMMTYQSQMHFKLSRMQQSNWTKGTPQNLILLTICLTLVQHYFFSVPKVKLYYTNRTASMNYFNQ